MVGPYDLLTRLTIDYWKLTTELSHGRNSRQSVFACIWVVIAVVVFVADQVTKAVVEDLDPGAHDDSSRSPLFQPYPYQERGCRLWSIL